MAECIVVIPCFNEAHRLDLRAFVEHAVRGDAALLFVNDGSSDGTGDVLDDLCAVSPANVAVLHLPHNCGKAEAVRRGVLQAFEQSPAYIGYWDADLATPLDAIGEFREYLAANPRVEMLLGARVRLLGSTIERRISRHCAGRVFATAASWVLQLPVYDTQCGAKLFRATDRTRLLFAEPFRSRWIFDVELLARFVLAATAAGQSPEELIHELPLRQWRDVAGSKVRPSDFVRAAIQLAE
ncbi:MAG TPA: glycosyltransferase, partial [Pirellulaceae bacterium]|nr:glycosyltransferase [Pirellulaceae bacterium]